MAINLGIPDVEDASEIGRGGFGVVYQAHQTKFDRTIAVKVLEQAQLDEAGRQRFERECKALGALSGHPNVVTIYDSGFTPAGWPYLVLEYLPDGSLGDRVDREGPLDIDQSTELIIKIAGALETAHRIGVLHRDLKPENILLGPYDEPKLGDFGIARVQGATMTATSTIWGSPAHAAPEIIEGKGATIQTDLYSLGSTIYVLLSGRLAFQRDTDESIIPVLARIATEPPPDLRSVGVPDEVWAVVAKAMAKDPSQRQTTAMAFGHELQAARDAIGLPHAEMRIKGEVSARRTGGAPRLTLPGSATPGPAAPAYATQPTYSANPTPVESPPSYPTPTPAAFDSGGYTPPPGYGTTTGQAPPAAPPPKTSNRTVWYVASGVVLLVAIIAGVVLVASSRGTTGTSTTTSQVASGGTLPSAQLKRALLNPADIKGSTKWSVSSDFGGFEGFASLTPCGKQVDMSNIVQEQFSLYEGSTPDDKEGRVFQAVAEFKDEASAEAFVQSVPSLIKCGSWTDDQGFKHNAVTQRISTPAGQDPVLVEDIYQDKSGAKYDQDLAFYRQGRFVGFVTNLVASSNDKNFSEELLNLGVTQLDKATR